MASPNIPVGVGGPNGAVDPPQAPAPTPSYTPAPAARSPIPQAANPTTMVPSGTVFPSIPSTPTRVQARPPLDPPLPPYATPLPNRNLQAIDPAAGSALNGYVTNPGPQVAATRYPADGVDIVFGGGTRGVDGGTIPVPPTTDQSVAAHPSVPSFNTPGRTLLPVQ